MSAVWVFNNRAIRGPDPQTGEAIAWLLVALAPSVVILHGKAGQGWAVLVDQCLVELEDERVPGIKRNIYLAAQTEILLRIALVHAVDEGRAAKGVANIK